MNDPRQKNENTADTALASQLAAVSVQVQISLTD